jgi:hypothetical protein
MNNTVTPLSTEPGQPKFLKRTDKGLVGFRHILKATYFGERKCLPFPHHTNFTLGVGQCTYWNSYINGTTLIPTLSDHLNTGGGGGYKVSVHSSNYLTPTTRSNTFFARQPQGLGPPKQVAS